MWPDTLAPLPGTSVSHKNNYTFPIHALPAEIILHILFISIDWMDVDKPLVPRLHNLAQVCAYWLHSIRSNSQFWSLISFGEQEWIDTIMRKNSDGPLAVRCISPDFAGDRVVEFLRFARQHVHRWDMVTFFGILRPEIVTLFKVHAPLLKYLDLRNVGYYGGPSNVHLSAPGLQHALFHHLHLPFNSTSLSGLRYLMISLVSSAFPSLLELVTILRASPALEWFGVEELRSGNRNSDIMSLGIGEPVHLPMLQGLLLHLVNHDIISAWIDAPNCHFFSGYIPFDVLTQPGSTAVSIAKIPIQKKHKIWVQLLNSHGELRIRSSKRPRCKLQCTQRRVVFQSIEITDVPNGVEPWRIVMELLGIPERRTEWFEVRIRHSPSTYSDDQITIWHSATSIFFGSEYPHVLRALKFLADSTVVDGEASWDCPHLKSIRFASGPSGTSNNWYPGVSLDALVNGILAFLWKRTELPNYVGSVGEEWKWPIPVKVTGVSPELFEELQGRVPEGIQIQDWYTDYEDV